MAILERGTHIAGHIIVRLIGAGRIADVYEAVAPEGAHRAVKLHREAAPLAARSQRSVGQEADAIARLDHVNVVGFYDTGIDEGRVWISLELVDGPDLRQLARTAGGTLPIERAVSIVRQAAEGMAAAHAHGILHRDLRPENILVAGENLAKVADFGSTKLAGWGVETTRDQDARSCLYVSPEYMKTGVAGPWSDVYAMGILLYEIISGESPFEGPPAPPIEICRRHIEDDPRPLAALVPKVPGGLSDLLLRALAKDPAERPTMRAFADVLAVLLQELHTRRQAAARSLPLPHRDPALALTVPAMPVLRSGGTIPMPAVPGPPAILHDLEKGPWPGVAPPPQASSVLAPPLPGQSAGREAVPPPPPESGIRPKAPSPPSTAARPPLPATLAMSAVSSAVDAQGLRPAMLGAAPEPPVDARGLRPVMPGTALDPLVERRSSGIPVERPAPPPSPAVGLLAPLLALGGTLLIVGLGAAAWLLSGSGGRAPASPPPPPPPAASASASPAASGAAPARSAAPARRRKAPERPRPLPLP